MANGSLSFVCACSLLNSLSSSPGNSGNCLYKVSIASNAYLFDIGKGLFNPGFTKIFVADLALASIAFVAASSAIGDEIK